MLNVFLKFDDSNKKLVDVSKNKKESNLEFLRKQLDCNLVDVQTIGLVDVWIDDEGLLTNNYENIHTLKYTDEDGKVEELVVAGSFVFADYNQEGDTIPLTNEMKKFIRENIEITSEKPQEYVNRTNGNEYNDGI